MRYLFGDYALDTRRCELRRTGRRDPAPPEGIRRSDLPHRPSRPRCLPQELLEHLWPQQFVGEATLKSCIKEARQAVGDTGKAQRLIQTLHGRGYRFVAAVEEASESPPAGRRTHSWLPARVAAGDLGPPMPHSPCLAPEDRAGCVRVAAHPPMCWKASASRSLSCAVLWPMPGGSQRTWGQRRCIASCGPSWPWRSA